MNNHTERIGRFQIAGQWPEPLLPTLQPLLKLCEPLIPKWCHIVYVRYDTNNQESESSAACQLHFDYRNAVLLVCKMFWDASPEMQLETLVHEIVHIHQTAVYNRAMDLLEEALEGNELALSFAQKQLNDANEGATCDMTALVVALMKD